MSIVYIPPTSVSTAVQQDDGVFKNISGQSLTAQTIYAANESVNSITVTGNISASAAFAGFQSVNSDEYLLGGLPFSGGTGPTGPAGSAGADGPAGEAGATGPTGASGASILALSNNFTGTTNTFETISPSRITNSSATYSTGTVAVSGTTVTGTGTTFHPSTLGGLFTSGSFNSIIVAYNSATSLTVYNSTTISAGASFSIRYAGFQTTGDCTGLGALTVASGQIGLGRQGTPSTYVNLTIPAIGITPYTLTLPSTAGTNGYFLQTNGAGTTSWAALPARNLVTTGQVLTTTYCYNSTYVSCTGMSVTITPSSSSSIIRITANGTLGITATSGGQNASATIFRSSTNLGNGGYGMTLFNTYASTGGVIYTAPTCLNYYDTGFTAGVATTYTVRISLPSGGTSCQWGMNDSTPLYLTAEEIRA